MREDHFIELLQQRPIGRLSERERLMIEAHAGNCSECLRAYRAAQFSSALLKARASETVEPSPFFKTKVMAAIRQNQLPQQQAPLARMWQAARAMVASMAAVVVILLSLTLLEPSPQQQDVAEQLEVNAYSAESVVLEDRARLSDDVTDDQVLATLMESEEDYADR